MGGVGRMECVMVIDVGRDSGFIKGELLSVTCGTGNRNPFYRVVVMSLRTPLVSRGRTSAWVGMMRRRAEKNFQRSKEIVELTAMRDRVERSY